MIFGLSTFILWGNSTCHLLSSATIDTNFWAIASYVLWDGLWIKLWYSSLGLPWHAEWQDRKEHVVPCSCQVQLCCLTKKVEAQTSLVRNHTYAAACWRLFIPSMQPLHYSTYKSVQKCNSNNDPGCGDLCPWKLESLFKWTGKTGVKSQNTRIVSVLTVTAD